MENGPRSCSCAVSALACVALITLTAAGHAAEGEDAITVVSWGGAYQQSQRQAYFEPFTDETGIPIEEEQYDGDFRDVIAQVDSGDATWEVVDVTLADAIRGCEQGYLEPIPPGMLPPAPDGTPPMEDFLPNTLHECAVGQILWSTLWAYNVEAFEGDAPQTVRDVFDTERYPGRRGMRKTPRNNLEWAVMADGVEPAEVYEVLRTDEGVERAFARLDSIRDRIEWWEDGSSPQEWLASGRVTVSTAYNDRVFRAIVEQDRPFDYIWDGQIWEIDLWAIPRDTRNLASVLKFVAFATGTRPLAEQSEYVAYAPARRSSLALVRPEYRGHMPTAPGNLGNALQSNFLWWADNEKRMDERFNAWLGGRG